MDKQLLCTRPFHIFEDLKNQEQYSQVVEAVQFLKQVISGANFSNFYVSFNGGKDATVALFLTVIALRQIDKEVEIRCLYFQESEPFPEINQFMEFMKKSLHLEIYVLKTKNYQIELYNFSKSNPIDYIVMGSRKDDPGCGTLNKIAESDVHKGYPSFKRINPILDWSYDFLWKFIRDFSIPYCKLYDEGYTSLGNTKNTKKNESLYDKQTNTYKQAYLASQQVERDCRKS